jgi:TPP-dependent pyruvate/acetoin dehydrogenase alpha subunit
VRRWTPPRAYVDEIRAGGGPRLMHAVTYRFKGHVSVDPGTYRDPAEVQAALADDPLLRARARLLALGATAADSTPSTPRPQAEIEPALAAAEAAPWPEAAAAYRTSWTPVQGCGDERADRDRGERCRAGRRR